MQPSKPQPIHSTGDSFWIWIYIFHQSPPFHLSISISSPRHSLINYTLPQRTSKMYTNPIIPGSNPDPSIIRVGADYFLVTSTFEYTPSAPIYHSKDLIKWTLIGHALTRPSQLQIQTPEPGGGVWATTIRYHQGVFYIVTSAFTRYRPQDDDRVWPRGFYVKSTNIWDEAGWSEPVWFDAVGFDQDV